MRDHAKRHNRIDPSGWLLGGQLNHHEVTRSSPNNDKQDEDVEHPCQTHGLGTYNLVLATSRLGVRTTDTALAALLWAARQDPPASCTANLRRNWCVLGSLADLGAPWNCVCRHRSRASRAIPGPAKYSGLYSNK